jgi:CheY-like chemotaxis protein
VIEGVQGLLERTLGAMISLRFELNPAPVPVLADPTQVEMMVLNLAINARDAMPDGGRLTIATRVRSIAEDPELAAGEYVEFSVADTGVGMDEPTLRRAMEPFFTTKSVGKGTGLGLAQVYGSARQAGGTVRIDSAPGEGTCVRVLLPCTDQAAAADQAAADVAGGAAQAPATILLVDDDPDVRNVLADVLRSAGHTVVEASGGSLALAALEAARPDLLLVDFAMPDMNGAELAREVRERRPRLPIVFASGFADTEAIERAMGPGATVLRKPFRAEQLFAAIGAALRAAEADPEA